MTLVSVGMKEKEPRKADTDMLLVLVGMKEKEYQKADPKERQEKAEDDVRVKSEQIHG